MLVDYAHTPDSLENVLRTARELTRGRLHVVFGAGGDRDHTKRPLMGEAAPRARRPRARDLRQPAQRAARGDHRPGDGGRRPGRRARRRPPPRDRARAIADAEPGDVVVIAGKGHEQGQEFENGRKEPFDDMTVAREALRAPGGRLMLGEIVMGGSASLLICMFLGPRFIDYLRLKEFGQQIREEGPAGHHGKAGHADDGRARDLHRDRGAVPDPFGVPDGEPRGAGHRARDGRARLRRRHHQAAAAALAGGLRQDQARDSGAHGDRAVGVRDRVRRPERHARPARLRLVRRARRSPTRS